LPSLKNPQELFHLKGKRVATAVSNSKGKTDAHTLPSLKNPQGLLSILREKE
jgi:hypothetical protein